MISFIFNNIVPSASTSMTLMMYYNIGSFQPKTAVEKCFISLEMEYFRRISSWSDFINKIKELIKKEEEIRFKLKANALSSDDNTLEELIQERDRIFEQLIIECMNWCTAKYLRYDQELETADLYIFFKALRLYNYWRSYTKFWEITRRIIDAEKYKLPTNN
jgi:hypothetical protein